MTKNNLKHFITSIYRILKDVYFAMFIVTFFIEWHFTAELLKGKYYLDPILDLLRKTKKIFILVFFCGSKKLKMFQVFVELIFKCLSN